MYTAIKGDARKRLRAQFHSISGAAAYYGVSRAAIHKWIRDARVPTLRVNAMRGEAMDVAPLLGTEEDDARD